MDVHVVPVDWATNGDRLRRLREQVFIVEQGVPREIEWDGLDEDAHHFIALNAAGVPLGNARLLATGQIGRIAVVAEHRGKGIGRRLLDLAVDTAAQLGIRTVFLHAQAHAVDFYARAGFVSRGQQFEEAGIVHVEMSRDLPVVYVPDADTRRLSIHNPDPAPEPNRSATVHHFRSEHDARERLYALMGDTHRHLDLSSPLLDHALFDTERCVAILSDIARRHALTRIRILIDDVTLVVARGHGLVELARRLSSKIEIRRASEPQSANAPGSFAVVDGKGLWLLPDASVYAGWCTAYEPVQAQRLQQEFVHRFERGLLDAELRLLTL